MDKIAIHDGICKEMHSLYERKNSDYGDSFAQLRKRYPNFVCMRLFDKLNRLDTIMDPNHKLMVSDEKVEDTLMDIANYCIMEITERRAENPTVEDVDYSSFDYSSLPKIVAVDFDGTLVENKFPNIGKLNQHLVDELFASNGRYRDYSKILFTNRSGKTLDDAIAYLDSYDIHFDAVNDDIPEVKELLKRDPVNHRKIWYDVLIDDKAINPSDIQLYT